MNERMQPIMDLIEDTLDAEITAQELADRAGYSLWHFCRMFQLDVGMPLMRYRLRRRLAHALYAMAQGDRVVDAALHYGFDTHAGFYKAFMREYGCSPTEYLKTHRALKPWRLQLKEERYLMLTLENWKKVLAAWGLDDFPLQPVVYEWSGMIADNAVYVGDNLILKAYQDPDRCQRMIALARAMHAAGLPVAYPQPLLNGDDALIFGAYHMVLWSRLNGHTLQPVQLLSGDVHANGKRIGRALRQLHNALDTVTDLPQLRQVDFSEHVRTWAMPRARAYLPASFPADFDQRLQAVSSLPRGIIHRDPNPGNLIDMPDGRIGLVDFDLSEINIRLFDLCYTCTGVLMEVVDRTDIPFETAWPQFLQGVLEGYGASTEERAAAPTVLLGIEIICIASFVGSEKYRLQFDTNMKMLCTLIRLLA